MADNILLVTYSGRTVTPQDDALVYEAAVSQSGIIYGGEVTFKNSNTLHIGAGHGIICGRKFTIIESDISIQLTTGAVNTGRLYVHLDLSNTTAPIQILTEIGTTLTAPIQQEDVNIVNGVYEFNLATFTVDAQTVSSVLSVAPAIKSYPVLTAEEFESGSSDRGYLVDASDVLAKFKAQTESIKNIETAFQDGCKVFVEDLTTNHGVEGIDSTSGPQELVQAYNDLIDGSGGGSIGGSFKISGGSISTGTNGYGNFTITNDWGCLPEYLIIQFPNIEAGNTGISSNNMCVSNIERTTFEEQTKFKAQLINVTESGCTLRVYGNTNNTVKLTSGTVYWVAYASETDDDVLESNGATLVWTNASPSSAFGTKTITVDLSAYGYALIVFAKDADSLSKRARVITPITSGSVVEYVMMEGESGSSTVKLYRTITVNSSSVKFSTVSQAGSSTTHTDKIIPLYIYGVNLDSIEQ